MDHSQAIMEDAGKAVEAGERAAAASRSSKPVDYDGERRENNDNRRKRNSDWSHDRQQYGSRGARNDNKRHKKGDMGRAEYLYVHHIPWIKYLPR